MRSSLLTLMVFFIYLALLLVGKPLYAIAVALLYISYELYKLRHDR